MSGGWTKFKNWYKALTKPKMVLFWLGVLLVIAAIAAIITLIVLMTNAEDSVDIDVVDIVPEDIDVVDIVPEDTDVVCEAKTEGNAVWVQGTVDSKSIGTCNIGYIGLVSRMCGSGGWQPITGQCSEVPSSNVVCEAKEEGDAVWVQGTVGSESTGTCVSGFIGNVSRECTSSGWQPIVGVCTQNVACPATIEGNASWSQGSRNVSVNGVCLPGFQGTVNRTCTQNGWSNITGQCLRSSTLFAGGEASLNSYSNITWQSPYEPLPSSRFVNAIIVYNNITYIGTNLGLYYWYVPTIQSPTDLPRWMRSYPNNEYLRNAVTRCFCIYQNKLYIGITRTDQDLPCLFTIDLQGALDTSLGLQLTGEIGRRQAVSSMIIWKNKLIITGIFRSAGTLTDVNGIVMYSDNGWERFSSQGLSRPGLISAVYDNILEGNYFGQYVTIYNDDLVIAGGRMNILNSDKVIVSKWTQNIDNTITPTILASWNSFRLTTPTGALLVPEVVDLNDVCVVKSLSPSSSLIVEILYVTFTLGKDPYVFKLENNVWTNTSFIQGVGDRLGRISSLIDYNGVLVACGAFKNTDGTIRNIAQYDGSTWSALGAPQPQTQSVLVSMLVI
jgi:hypothetical protein